MIDCYISHTHESHVFVGSHTHLYVLLNNYTATESTAIRDAIEALVSHVLSESILFKHDPDEVHFWLASLPFLKRAPGAEAPDGAALTDERQTVIAFLDECVQRCMKTPYRYLEDLDALVPSSGADLGRDSQSPDARPSPLIMTVVEQLAHKVAGGLLAPSDVLAVVTFIRKLVLKIAGKQQDIRIVNSLVDRITSLPFDEHLSVKFPVLKQAVLREISILRVCLRSIADSPISVQMEENGNPAVEEFLEQVEQLPIRAFCRTSTSDLTHDVLAASKLSRQVSAYELVDWLRLVQCSLQINDVRRLLVVIERLYKPAIGSFMTHLDPRQNLLWDVSFAEAGVSRLESV